MVTELMDKTQTPKKAESFLSKSPCILGIYDNSIKKYVYVNENVFKILGYTPKQFMAMGEEQNNSIIHPMDLPLVIEKNDIILNSFIPENNESRNLKPIIKFKYRIKHLKGHWVWLHTERCILSRTDDNSIEFMLDVSTTKTINKKHILHRVIARSKVDQWESGKILHFPNALIDITGRNNKSQQRVMQLSKQADAMSIERLELMATTKAKDEFIALASHQLRTPATVVSQYIGLLKAGFAGELNDEQLEFVNKAYESNDRQLKIVDALLKVALVDAGKVKINYRSVNLVDLISDVLQEQSSVLTNKDQSLIFQASSESVIIRIDPDLLRMVIENLISNASKYSETDKEISVILSDNKSNTTIAVKDQGIGITSTDIPKLFKKFTRLDNPLATTVGGTGLGLYWSKQIIDMHGGSIKVESEPSVSSTFLISLPKRRKSSKNKTPKQS